MKRRTISAWLIALAALLSASTGGSAWASSRSDFVTVENGQFKRDGAPYRFVGVNLWYGAYLGAKAPLGNRERLKAELDHLKRLGITNVRVLGGSEQSPLKNSLKPAFLQADGTTDSRLLEGLDYLLAELAARDMTAVIYLTNFWEWSGGMATYLYWTNGNRIVDPADPAHPWPAFALFTKDFYASVTANERFRAYAHDLLSRRNSVTGVHYSEDPTIMSWQLANEPRPGYRPDAGNANLPAFYQWIDESSAFIKARAPNQLVSTGSEGFMGCVQLVGCTERAHSSKDVDYITVHLWPLNWGWFDPKNMAATFPQTLRKTNEYLDYHDAVARKLNKPIVLEEFGLTRDNGAVTPGSPTTYRDRLLRDIFARIERDAKKGGYIAGSNIWSWGGKGRAQHTDHQWRAGDTSYLGDPPQEPQGRNSVFDSDRSTLKILSRHASRLRRTVEAAK